LEQSILFPRARVLFPISAPILRVALPPAFSAISLVLLIGRIHGQLLALPKGLASPLAFQKVTVSLIFYAMIWNNIAATMRTANPIHGLPPGKTIVRRAERKSKKI
jgi:hypothetical protein